MGSETFEGRVCSCTPHDQDAGGGYVEHLLEYDPACAIHSSHLYDPRQGVWVMSQRPHQMKLLYDTVEVCDTCRNINGEYVAWDQTWHALRQDPTRDVQHCWSEDESGNLTAMCGDENARQFMPQTAEESRALPVCRVCHSKAVARARAQAREEVWDLVTSERGVKAFKDGWSIGLRLNIPKTQNGLNLLRKRLRGG